MLTTYIIYKHEEVNYESKKPFTSFLSENKSKFNNDFKEKLFYSGYNSPLRKKAIYVLEILSDILCDSQNNSFIEQFSTVIADKWLLLLLSDENPKCVIYGLKILSRLIILKKSNYISKFSSKTHGFLFMKLYLKRWWNNISIWKIIFCLFFGMDILNIKENITNMNNFETFLEFLLKENRNVTKIFCFEVFDVILAMLEADSIINPSKNYILELNIQIPSCFFGNQIYIESCILYTTLIKLHKIIQNQLNKLNEISVLSNINDFSNDCLNCVRKGHFFMCESLFKFLLCILNYVHKMNIKKQKKTYQQIFINIQECFHHVLFLQLSTLKIYNEEGKFQTFIEEILSHNHIILQLLTANQGFIAYFCYWLYILLFSKSYNLRIISINFWKLIAQQRSHELFSVFNQITPSDHSIINTFLNMCNFVNNKNKKILQNLEHGDCILEIYNICRINGLNAHEGLLLLGRNNLYFMNNYFLKSDGEITTIWDLTIKNERDLYVQLLSDKNISKEMFFSKNQHETKKWPFNQILSIYKRSFLFRDVGLELFFIDGQSFLITLSTKERELVYNKLISKLSHTNYLLSKNFLVKDNFIDTIKSQISVSKFGSRVINMFNSSHSSLKKWKNGKMSNFHYLMIINTLTGRTYNDLTQYPIFPWVLADYSSEELDLTNPKTFRDFSKPMGAQNPVRRNNFEKRFKSLQEMQDSSQPPFHYGTHYSSAMIVCSYLIRLKPFVDSYLLLQGGSFDHADRLFYSIEKAWLSSSQGNMTDVRELIPEFFYLPEFLVNSNNYNFGIKQENNEVIDSVILPPWAKGDPKLFIKKHREALECDYVSEHLNEWIDLIFGFKQQGELAIKATNIFHHLSYKDIDKIEDPVEKMATIGIIYNFGQTPKQIFQQPHPKKNYNSEKSITTKKLSCVKKYEKNINSLIQAIMFFKENDFSIKTIIYLKELDKLIVCPSNRIYMLPNVNIYLQWDAIGGDIEFYNKENKKIFRSLYKLHSQKITCSYFIEPYTLITASNDCIIYIWSIIQGETIELKQKGCLRGHSKPIISLDSSKSFSIIVSGSEDGLAIEWDLNRICYLRTLEKSSKPIQCVSINDTNGDIATCSETTISIWTINGDLLLRQNIQFSQNDMIFSCKFYEGINNEWLDCDLIFTGHKSGIVQIWNILWETENGKSIRKLINVKTLQHYDFIKKSLLISEITALYPSGETRSLFTDRKYNCHPCGAILCSNCTYQHPKIEKLNYEDDDIDKSSKSITSSESDSKYVLNKPLDTRILCDNSHAIQANAYDIIPTCAAPHSTSINIITATSCIRWIFTGGNDGYIRKYDFFSSMNGKIPLTVAQKHPFVDSVVNAGVLLSYWENKNSQELSTTSISTNSNHKLSPVYCLAVNRHALWMLSGLDTGDINLQTVRHDEGKILTTMKQHISPVSVLKLSTCETKVLSGGWDKNVYEWDLNTGLVCRSYNNHTGQISTIAFRPVSPSTTGSANSINNEPKIDMKLKINKTNNFSENLFNSILNNNKEIKKKNISDFSTDINNCTNKSILSNELFQSKNEFIVSGIDGTVTIWDKRQSKHITKLGIPTGTPPWCMNACWSADGKNIYVGRRNETVDEFSIYSSLDKPLRSIKLPLNSGPVSAVHSMPNGKHLICASYDNIRIYDLNGSSKIPFLIIPGHYGGIISSIYIDNTCKYMLTASGNRGWDGNYTETLLGYEIEYL
ncbi:hypothetical protein PCANB_002340 [Pneumocystis canis]|nr:hypothetical protein PCANB_002340 [Pneumocystis canis]